MEKTEVLVVGAGPTGLAAAGELSRLGVKVRIIDLNSGRTDKSKALGVQAGTLEALASRFGENFAQKMVADGLPVKKAVIHLFDSDPVSVDLSRIPSRFDFVLVLAQSETERLLEEHLNAMGIQVERKTELRGFKQVGEKIIATIGENSEEVQCDFILGADGAHSRVRHQLDIPFLGGSYAGEFVLGDVILKWDLEPGTIQSFIGKKGLLVAFPIDQGGRYRLIFSPLQKSNSTTMDISFEEFSELAAELCPEPIKFLKSFWLTRFSVHHRITRHFRVGRAFLAGDACHIHSPAGGQGMNTGIQDALNLSLKMAEVLKKNAPMAILDSYEAERLPIAQDVVKKTDFVTRVGLMPPNAVTKFMREKIAPILIRSHFLQTSVMTGMSQVKIARNEIERDLR